MAGYIKHRGPMHGKIVWTQEDQRKAMLRGFYVKPDVQFVKEGDNYYPTKYERVKLVPLLAELTDQKVLALLVFGEWRCNPFYERLGAFIRQQRDHGWVGAWTLEGRSRHPRRLKQATRYALNQELARQEARAQRKPRQ